MGAIFTKGGQSINEDPFAIMQKCRMMQPVILCLQSILICLG